jgi:Zn-dependent protease
VDPLELAAKVGLFFIPFLFALCFHEFAHGFIAKLRGDNTAEMMGRLTLNPLAHVDWVGTVGLPIMAIIFQLPLFGWAKPVPVNPRNLKDPKNDMFWVALAGPASNILLFILGIVGYYILFNAGAMGSGGAISQMLVMFLYINIFLAIFNLLPLHPLDGGKILERFIPYHWNRWLEDHQYQLNLVLLGLIIFGGLRFMLIPAQFLIHSTLRLIETGVI